MNHESDHVHMMALADALSIPLAVEYLDRSSPHLLQHTFGPPPAAQQSSTENASTSASACVSATAQVANGFLPEPTCVPKPSDASQDTSKDASQDLRALHVTLLYRPGHLDILYGK